MKAIILAAGKGERLGQLTRNTPKSLLEIGQGVTVVESQLDHLAQAGIKRVVLVVGFKAEQIEAKLKDYDSLSLSTVFNPFYDVSNNLLSLWTARAEMAEDFILVNGDDVFKPSVVSNLLKSSEPITMVIDRKPVYDEDDMKVVTEGAQVQKISKQIPLEVANGESIGMMAIREGGRERFIEGLDQLVRMPEKRNAFYLEIFQRLIDSGYPIGFSECDPDDWAEIDFHPDLELIRTNIERFSDKIKSWG